MLERQKHHIVAFRQECVDEVKELNFDLLLKVRPDQILIPTKDQEEDDVIELVEHEES